MVKARCWLKNMFLSDLNYVESCSQIGMDVVAHRLTASNLIKEILQGLGLVQAATTERLP